MKYIRNVLVTLIAIIVAGCVSVSVVEKGRVTIDGAYSVQNIDEWASIKVNNLHLWTVDGPALQELRFVTALEDGETMFQTNSPEKVAKFRGEMNELEVVEFFLASLAAIGIQPVKTANFRPIQFGAKGGFRFDYDYLTKDGLAMKGFASGAIVEKKLYMIFYTGTRQHYFDKRQDAAQRVMDSVRFL